MYIHVCLSLSVSVSLSGPHRHTLRSTGHTHTLTTIWSNLNLHPEKPLPWWQANLNPHPEALSFSHIFSFPPSLHLFFLCHIQTTDSPPRWLYAPPPSSPLWLAVCSRQSHKREWLRFGVVGRLASGSEVGFRLSVGLRFWGLVGFQPLWPPTPSLCSPHTTRGEYPKTHTHTLRGHTTHVFFWKTHRKISFVTEKQFLRVKSVNVVT